MEVMEPSPTQPSLKKRRALDDPAPDREGDSEEILLVCDDVITVASSSRRSRRTAESAQVFRLLASPYRVSDRSARVDLAELVEDPFGTLDLAVVSNFLIDPSYLLSTLPALRSAQRVAILCDRRSSPALFSPGTRPSNFEVHCPPLTLDFGTHHTKMFLLVYRDRGLRVIVHTANLVPQDFGPLSMLEQAAWSQDFPLKSVTVGGSSSPFEDALVDYMKATQWPGTTIQGYTARRFTADSLRAYDFSGATGAFVASVPGRHRGRDLVRWGHLAIRAALDREMVPTESACTVGATLVLQYSSCGSIRAEKATGDSRWLSDELASSLKARMGSSVALVWPTVTEIAQSCGGYESGNSVPGTQKNVEVSHLRRRYHRFGGRDGERILTPHLKTMASMDPLTGRMNFVLLTSCNLSKAALGELQLQGSQLQIRSYEAGVLITPQLLGRAQNFKCTPNGWLFEPEAGGAEPRTIELHPLRSPVGGAAGGEAVAGATVARVPIPYALPLRRYSEEDLPWCVDRVYGAPDSRGRVHDFAGV